MQINMRIECSEDHTQTFPNHKPALSLVTLPNQMNSNCGTHIRRRRKHRNSDFKLPWNWNKNEHSADVGNTSPVNFLRGCSPTTQLSARKLAAGLWQLRFLEVSPFPLHSSQFSNSKLESYSSSLKCSKEEVTKIHREKKLIGESVVVSALLSELLRAQSCINKRKAKQKSFKKRLEQVVQKLEEERVLWKLREHQKVQALLDDFKEKLERERMSRERMEFLNAKLVYKLVEAKLYVNQIMMNYEEERKERELIEEVCNELAMQVGEDKAKLEELQRHSIEILEEVEQERKMFQMAGLMREESIQIKLVDAKLVLEDKYNQMIQLIAYLQNFLRSRGNELDSMELREAELIKQAAESVNIQSITEFSYDFTKSNDIFSMYEDHLNNLHQSSTSNDYSTGLKVTNSLETVDHVELQNISLPPEMRGASLDNVNQDKDILGSEEDCCENTDLESLKTRVNGPFSVSIGQSKWKVFSAPELLRSCQSDGTSNSAERPEDDGYKHHDSVAQQNSEDVTFDECKGTLATGSIEVTSTFMCKGSVEGVIRHTELLGPRNSTDTMNPHVTRGMKGCIEWPRGIPKINSKVIPLEERVRKQKSQLQHMLKPQA